MDAASGDGNLVPGSAGDRCHNRLKRVAFIEAGALAAFIRPNRFFEDANPQMARHQVDIRLRCGPSHVQLQRADALFPVHTRIGQFGQWSIDLVGKEIRREAGCEVDRSHIALQNHVAGCAAVHRDHHFIPMTDRQAVVHQFIVFIRRSFRNSGKTLPVRVENRHAQPKTEGKKKT